MLFIYNEENHTITTVLPSKRTNQELLKMASSEITDLKTLVKHGGVLKITGRCSLPLMSFLTHSFGHLHQAICVYDPKLDRFLVTISHSPEYSVGDLI